MRLIKLFTVLSFILILYSCSTTKSISTRTAEINIDTLSSKQKLEFQYIFYEANQYFLEGNNKLAISLFNDCLKIDPKSSVSYYKLSEIYKQINEPILAQKYAELAVLYNPDNIWYQQLVGELYSLNNENDKAEEVFKKLIKINPDNINFYLYLADIYIKKEDYNNAIKISDKIEDKFGISENITLKKSKLYLAQNKKKEALKELIKLSEAFPEEINYKLYIAEFYLDIKDFDNAIKEYNNILKKYPDEGYPLLGLANCYLEKHNTELFQKYLLLAFDSNKMPVDLKYNILSSMLKDRNQYEKEFIYKLSEKLYNKYPNNIDVILIYTTIKLEQKDDKLSRKLLIQVVEKRKDNYEVWKQLIFLDYQFKSWDTLYNHSSEAITYFPNQVLLYYFKGFSAFQTQDYQTAINSLTFGLKLITKDDPMRFDFITYIGESYYKLNEKEKAYKYFDDLLKIDSNNTMILNNYAYYLSLDNINLSKAEKMSKITIQREPKNPTYLDTYAWILFKQNKNKEALIFIKQAVTNDTLISDVVLEHYGDILYKNNEIDKAVEQWIKAREIGEGSGLLDKKINEKKLFE